MNLSRPTAALTLAFALCLCVSCRTGPPLPPADFSAPGWQVHQGQAVWKPPGKRPELTGDLLLATNAVGDFYIQFSKTPFTIAAAQRSDDQWQIDFGTGQHHWRGHGTPPKYFSWFQLPVGLNGAAPRAPWKFTRKEDDAWRLENPRTGEWLEGVLFP